LYRVFFVVANLQHVGKELVANGPLTLPEVVGIQSSKKQASDPDAIEATEVRAV
jgi:hypothetical protein